MRLISLMLLMVALLAAHVAQAAPKAAGELATVAERTGYRETGRYEEVLALCKAFEAAHEGKAKCTEFGKTPELRPMVALVVSGAGHLTPETAKQSGQPVLVFQGGIHAGEIDGKDAGFLLLRDLLTKPTMKRLVEKSVIVFVPVFNVDGHERFGRNNRPNQNGPDSTGWRTTAQNLNLNRDYVKADAPETVALLKLLNIWDPVVYADLHVTDGAQFEHDVAICVQPASVGTEPMLTQGRALRDLLLAKLTNAGHLPLGFYPEFIQAERPESGFALGFELPRYATGYWEARGRIGILIETHSWKSYEQRVRATYDAVLGIVEAAAVNGPAWVEAARAVDQVRADQAGKSLPLTYKNTSKVVTLDFHGYEYTRQKSEVSGGDWIKYDTAKPQIWRVPYYPDLQVDLSVIVPQVGYVVPPAFAQLVSTRLALHGVRFEVLRKAMPRAPVQTYRAQTVKVSDTSFEGRQTATVTGRWKDEPRDLPAGTLLVPSAQPNLKMAAYLLEPSSPDSLVYWGYFNSIFERKEIMEEYVAEEVAREMLKDGAVKAEFEKLLSSDPEFAQSPKRRLDFFYKKHASFDERLNLYPVYRVEKAWPERLSPAFGVPLQVYAKEAAPRRRRR